MAILHMLTNVTPRFIPHHVDEHLRAVIFADAYVKVGEVRHKAGHIPSDLPQPPHVRDDNGWGYVVRIGEQVLFCHGTTPRSVLNQITSRKAFIYALEIFAQLLAILSLAQRLPANWLAFIDNTAGEAALRKGLRQGRLRERHARGRLGNGGTPGLETTLHPSGVQSQRRRRHLQRRPFQGQPREHRHPHQSGQGRRLRGGPGGGRPESRH